MKSAAKGNLKSSDIIERSSKITCCKCGCTKSLAEFHQNKRNKFGVDTRCKICVQRIKKKRPYKKRQRKKILSKFIVAFNGDPDESLMAARLQPFLEVLAPLIK